MTTIGKAWVAAAAIVASGRDRPGPGPGTGPDDRADRRFDHHPQALGLRRAGLHPADRPGARRRRGVHQHRDAVPRLRAVSDERERRHLHAGRAGAGQGAGLGRVRPGLAGQQPHRRLRRPRHAADEEVRGRGRDRRRRIGREPDRGPRGQVPRYAEGTHRARLGGVHLPGSLARRPHPRRRPGPARAEPAALHHHLRRDQGALRAAAAGRRRAHRHDAGRRRHPDVRRPAVRRRRHARRSGPSRARTTWTRSPRW